MKALPETEGFFCGRKAFWPAGSRIKQVFALFWFGEKHV